MLVIKNKFKTILKKLLRILKTAAQVFLVMALGFAISLGVLISVQENARFPSPANLIAWTMFLCISITKSEWQL